MKSCSPKIINVTVKYHIKGFGVVSLSIVLLQNVPIYGAINFQNYVTFVEKNVAATHAKVSPNK